MCVNSSVPALAVTGLPKLIQPGWTDSSYIGLDTPHWAGAPHQSEITCLGGGGFNHDGSCRCQADVVEAQEPRIIIKSQLQRGSHVGRGDDKLQIFPTREDEVLLVVLD